MRDSSQHACAVSVRGDLFLPEQPLGRSQQSQPLENLPSVVRCDSRVLSRSEMRQPIYRALLRSYPITQSHFRKNLYRKTGTLVYILEEYMLSGLLPDEPSQFVSMVVECYVEADDMPK